LLRLIARARLAASRARDAFSLNLLPSGQRAACRPWGMAGVLRAGDTQPIRLMTHHHRKAIPLPVALR